MAELNDSNKEVREKSPHAIREEGVLAYWKDNGIFEKTLEKTKEGKPFIFYEGPPTANGHPGIHHLEARAFKDTIPRYKTMCGFYVRRKGGWDTHGLPVELQVEKELGLKSKKEIDTYGIAEFNEKCKESVWKYVHEWEDFTNRMGYWVDLKDPYITYKSEYIESVWNIIKTVDDKKLLYKDYKVVPWCPRCGTGLSSHELAQGYAVTKDLAVTVRFRIKSKGEANLKFEIPNNTYLLAWTTTPWTLPGNVGLAVGEKIDYVQIKIGEESLILAKSRLSIVKDEHVIEQEFKGKDLIGIEYEPLYSFIKDNIDGPEKDKLVNAYKVYSADFVTTDDGTGIVHIAVMYGQDDFELGTKAGLPKYHLVNEDGTFKSEAGFIAGKFVKDEATDVEIIKDLAHRGLLFGKAKHEHSYPFCWRCKTPLIYFARDSWYIRMSALRNDLVKENEGIHWEPDYIKEGRFGEWLREIKDWAISRERYWGTPLPIWTCDKCKEKKVVGSVSEIKQTPKNSYWLMRHGEAESNVKKILNSDITKEYHVTSHGGEEVEKTANSLKDSGIDLIIASPFVRTQDTAHIVQTTLGLKEEQVLTDDRLREIGLGSCEGIDVDEWLRKFPLNEERFTDVSDDGIENYAQIKKRVGEFLYDIESKYSGKNILIITHGGPAMMLFGAAEGLNRKDNIELEKSSYIQKAEARKLNFSVLPHNSEYELDLHRPYIDQIKFRCSCGGEMTRAKEVMDVWLDSGAMPFAQDHYPFGFKKHGLLGKDDLGYPADFISEAIDQTRGWFYTLHAIGILMGKGKAYKNVICLGHILDGEGKKMSKSVGNVIDPWKMMDKYGVDALRFWMYSVNQPGDSKSFDEKTVDEIIKKVFNLVLNVTSFYKMYVDENPNSVTSYKEIVSTNILDKWIISRSNQLVENVTQNLDNYILLEPTRAIRDFIGDLSQWYLRRSRDRFKGDDENDKNQALATTKHVLITLAKLMAPFTPIFAEHLYKEINGDLESVHLEDWPEVGVSDIELIESMKLARDLSSKGLEARMTAKINVRQPLSKFSITSNIGIPKYWDELKTILADEINVKEVELIKDPKQIEMSVHLDSVITPLLKEEGDLRELLRKIQDMRKEKGLSVNDITSLIVTEDMRTIISKNENLIKKTTKLNTIEYGSKFELKA